MVCKSCGEKPENTAKDFTKAVVEINNPDKLVLFRKVVVPVSMGTEEDFPASVGKYYNVLLQYEANGDMYLYSSDGIPTKLSSDVSELQYELEQLGIKVDEEILARTAGDDALSDAIADEKTAREGADTALGNRITALDNSLATVAKTGNYNDLTNKPTIGNATLTIKRNNVNVGTFTANATSNKSIDIAVPTKTSELTNDGSDNTSTYVEADELATVATSGSYNDLTNKPTIPTVNNATLTIQKNGTNVQTFTANSSENKTANITVPTAVSELTNDADYATTTQLNNGLATKQNTLIAGNAIKISGDTISADVYPADFFTNATETTTAEGTDTTMQGTALAPFESITPKGDTSQQTYTGKNLLPYPFSSGGSNPRGITFTTNSDGSVTLNGQNDGTGQTVYFLFNNSGSPMPLSAGTYYFAPPANTAISYLIYDGSYHGFSSSNNYTQTFNADTSVQQIYITVPQGNTTNFNNFKIYPMLTTLSGQTEADYEPYVGGVPSPNPEYPQDVKVVTGEQTVKVTNEQLLTAEGMATPITNTDFWNTFSAILSHTPRANGWATIAQNETGYGNFFVNWDAVSEMATSTTYTIIFELKNVVISGTSGALDLIQTNQSQDPFETFEIITGASASTSQVVRVALASADAVSVVKATTKDSVNARSLRMFTRNTVPAGTSFDIRVSVLKGDHTTDWQEYAGNNWKPYQSQEYLLGLHGKNIFNKNDLTMRLDGEYINTNENRLDSSVNARCVFVQIEGGKTYTVSKVATTYSNFRIAASIEKPAWRVPLYNIQSASGSATSLTITTPENCKYLVVWWGRVDYQPSEQEVLDSIQIEEGSTATTYEAYAPIELCKIGNYQDYIYKSGNDWYKHEVIKKITLPTSNYLRWTTHSEAGMFYQNGVLSDALFQTGAITAVVENLPVKPQVANMTEYYNTYAQVNKYGFVLKTDTPGIMIQNKNYSTLTDFHAWIAANPVEVRYVLATPVDIQITNEALIEQLGALSNANSYRDVTYITTASDGENLPVILTAEAFTNTLAGISKVIDGKQEKLTAGENITIDANNVISANAAIELTTADYNYPEEEPDSLSVWNLGIEGDIILGETMDIWLHNGYIIKCKAGSRITIKNIGDNAFLRFELFPATTDTYFGDYIEGYGFTKLSDGARVALNGFRASELDVS